VRCGRLRQRPAVLPTRRTLDPVGHATSPRKK
jgi:hypothetical protein